METHNTARLNIDNQIRHNHSIFVFHSSLYTLELSCMSMTYSLFTMISQATPTPRAISDKIYQFPIYLSQGNLNPWDAALATTSISFFIGFLGTTLDLFVILTVLFFTGTMTFFGEVDAAEEPEVISMNFLFVLDIRSNPPNPALLKSAGFMLWSAIF